MFSLKNLARILIDLALLTLAFVAATFLRLSASELVETKSFIWNAQLPVVLAPVILVQIFTLIITGTYARFWRYAGVFEFGYLARSLLLSNLILLIPRLIGMQPSNKELLAISFGVVVIDFMIALGFLSTVRLLRVFYVRQRDIKRRIKNFEQENKRTLIIGAGEACIQAIEAIQAHPELGLKVVGALDDDKKKHKMNIASGIKVFGPTDEVGYWVSELAVDQIIIAIPSLNLQERKKINLLCSETEADVRMIPSVDQLAGGKVDVQQIRKLSMEDLLGREEVALDEREVVDFIAGKRVLVTGAGGSIGREICKQLITKAGIKSLCLLGKGENSIFETYQELLEMIRNGEIDENIEIETKIVDIRNYSRMHWVFESFKPDIVFHAAAHKHVHLMELNACEAFENNVHGTRNVADLAGKAKVQAFVLVSTDKAVNPTSIMGATKSIAEKAMLNLSKNYPDVKYTVVRFGNVLGSRGSVIKVWEKQIQATQRITVTHKDAIRYFMTIPEASQLVIKASAKANSGEVMVLDMGEPIKIFELAKQFIRLSGFSLEEVPIDIIGLKPGEKLYEELLTAEEFIENKLDEKIFRAKICIKLSEKEFDEKVADLTNLAAANKLEATKNAIRSFIGNESLRH